MQGASQGAGRLQEGRLAVQGHLSSLLGVEVSGDKSSLFTVCKRRVKTGGSWFLPVAPGEAAAIISSNLYIYEDIFYPGMP